jgi:mRNA interferase RelE/StbE
VAYSVTLIPAAEKALEKLPRETGRRIVRRLTALGQNPRPSGAKALQGVEGLLRVRVGDYRIVYRVADGPQEVTVVRIAHRSDVYR